MGMVSLELDDEQKLDTVMPVPTERPDYPWGTRVSLSDSELTKLGIDPKALTVGQMLHLEGMACVTTVSITDSEGDDGPCCRIELQFQSMGVVGAEQPKKPRAAMAALYDKS